jgi:hypothetical protein
VRARPRPPVHVGGWLWRIVVVDTIVVVAQVGGVQVEWSPCDVHAVDIAGGVGATAVVAGGQVGCVWCCVCSWVEPYRVCAHIATTTPKRRTPAHVGGCRAGGSVGHRSTRSVGAENPMPVVRHAVDQLPIASSNLDIPTPTGNVRGSRQASTSSTMAIFSHARRTA